MSLFELVTGAIPIDCIVKEQIYFVVDKKNLKNIFVNRGEKIKMLRKHIKKNVVVFPYCDTKEEFLNEVISDRVKIKENDALKLFINRQDTKKVKRDQEAIKNFLERIYKVNKVLFRW